MRIMVQDSTNAGVRGVAMDLLDTPGSPLSTAAACDAVNPCLPEFTLGGTNPDFSCTLAGYCNDPLAAGAAPLTPPESGLAGELSGTMIRLVFNKLLNSSFETVTVDSTQLPGSDKIYAVEAGIVEIDDATGAAIGGQVYWDPSGSPTNSSDPILHPYGPALVFKPLSPLSPNATYTVKLTAARITDRDGNPLADQNGNLVSGIFAKPFTTENVQIIAATTLTDVTTAGVALTPDEILQLGFNSFVDPATVTCTASNGTAVTVRAYSEAGSDLATCQSALDPALLNIVAVDNQGAPTNWPAGTYTLSCTGRDALGGASTFTVSGTFDVSGTPVAGDPSSYTQHVICP
jgi:hypothetical protein